MYRYQYSHCVNVPNRRNALFEINEFLINWLIKYCEMPINGYKTHRFVVASFSDCFYYKTKNIQNLQMDILVCCAIVKVRIQSEFIIKIIY